MHFDVRIEGSRGMRNSSNVGLESSRRCETVAVCYSQRDKLGICFSFVNVLVGQQLWDASWEQTTLSITSVIFGAAN